jgi:hypothetical protein
LHVLIRQIRQASASKGGLHVLLWWLVKAPRRGASAGGGRANSTARMQAGLSHARAPLKHPPPVEERIGGHGRWAGPRVGGAC